MDEIRCNKIEVLTIEYERNLDFEVKENEIPVSLQAEYGENEDPEEKNARLILQLQMSQKKYDNPFYCKLKVAGYFEWEELEAEEAKEKIKKEGAEILFSFIRTYLYNLMQSSGIDPFVLPIEHFDTEE